jgi:hypothetical protein
MAIGQTNYPTTLDGDAELLTAHNNIGTTLNGLLSSGSSTITVYSTAGFPTSDVIIIEGEMITYTGKTGTTFTGCTRGQFLSEGGLAASAHADLSKVELLMTARHHNVLKEAIKALQAKVGVGAGPTLMGTTAYVVDDFMTGSITSGNVGQLQWLVGNGTTSQVISEINHPGLLRRETGTTISTYAYLALRTSAGSCISTDMFTMRFNLRLNTSDNATKIRVGGLGAYTSDPTYGCYFEKLESDTNWFGVTRTGGVQTRVNTGVAATQGSWVNLVVRRVDASTIGFKVNTAAEVFSSTNISTNGAMNVGFHLVNTAAANKSVDIDWFDMSIVGLVR